MPKSAHFVSPESRRRPLRHDDAQVFGLERSESQRVSRLIGKAAFQAALGLESGDGERRVGVDQAHALGLHFPVLLGVLDNAQRVDPDIFVSEFPGDRDGVAESLGEIVQVDSLSEPRHGRMYQLGYVRRIAPAVTQSDIGLSVSLDGID